MQFQCSHQDFALGSPRAPSAEKQGPCKNIRGTKLHAVHDWCGKNSSTLSSSLGTLGRKKESNFRCAMVYQLFLHQQKSRSRYSSSPSTYLIQYGQRGVYDSITMHTPIFTMYMGTTKSTATKLKTESFDNMFFIHLNKQNAGVLG